jgi:hypothetical protein
MTGALRYRRIFWLAVGLAMGTAIGGLWPHTPLHAIATDRSENIIIATGLINENVEAIFFLDSLTGTLRAAVPSQLRMVDYQAMWEANASADLMACIRTVNANVARLSGGKGAAVARPAIQMPQAPRFLMVTGLMDIRQGSARMRPSRSVVYVAEANTGIVMTYLLPWSDQMHTSNQPLRMPMTLWAADQFPTAVIRAAE